MKRSLAFLIAAALTVPLFAQETARYIVATRRSAHIADLRMLRDAGDSERHAVREFEELDGFAATLTASEVAELRASREVRYVSEVVPRSIASSPYVRQQVLPWGVDVIHARDVWPVTKGNNATVHVAVVDTGVDRTHPDLAGKYAGGYDVFAHKDDPIDDNKHGTHVAGIITANDNAFGTVGAAPNVKIWAVKVLDAQGNGTDESLMAGLDWVVSKKKEIGGNWIVNLSLSGARTSPAETEYFRNLIAQNILVVAAAGNRGYAAVEFPAGHRNVLSVCALERDLTRAGFSSFGVGLTLCAPGVDVPSTVPAGLVTAADIETSDGIIYNAVSLNGSPKGEATGSFVYCGEGRPQEIPSAVSQRIAVVRRSPAAEQMYFQDKVRNAMASGATAVVIINDDDMNRTIDGLTLILLLCDTNGCIPDPNDVTFPFALTLAISNADGEKLLAQSPEFITTSYRDEVYAPLSGTSMAAPHVVAAAALAWSVAPNATAEQVRLALELTATDLNTRGWDPHTGFGLVNALKAAQYLNPGAFGLAAPPVVEYPKRRGR